MQFIGRIWTEEGRLRGSIEFVGEPGEPAVRRYFSGLDEIKALIEERLNASEHVDGTERR